MKEVRVIISGWAFTKNAQELQEINSKRFEEIKNIKGVIIKKVPCYGHCEFTGKLTTPEAKALSEFDLAILADYGSLCFGGNCSKTGDTFRGTYFTD